MEGIVRTSPAQAGGGHKPNSRGGSGRTRPAPAGRRWTGLAGSRLLPALTALLVIAAGSATAGSGPELSTLEEMLAHAMEHHPALQAARLEREAEEATIAQVRSLPDPTVSVKASTMERQVGIGATQMIPMAGRRGLRGAIATEGARASARVSEGTGLAVRAGVTGAYAELVYLSEAQRFVAENLNLVRDLEKVALARYRTGEAPFADVVRAQVEVGRVEDELRSLTEVEEAAVARLNAAMGRPVGAPLPPPKGFPPIALALEEEEVLAAVGESNPDLAVLRHRGEAASLRLELARRNRTPDLMVGLELMHSGDMNRTGVGAMVGINLPIRRESRAAEIREAGARSAAVLERTAARNLELEAEARMVLFGYQDAGRKEELYTVRLIPQVEQTLAAVQTAYRSGESTFGELVETSRLVLEFRLARVRAQAEQLRQLAALEVLTGRRLLP